MNCTNQVKFFPQTACGPLVYVTTRMGITTAGRIIVSWFLPDDHCQGRTKALMDVCHGALCGSFLFQRTYSVEHIYDKNCLNLRCIEFSRFVVVLLFILVISSCLKAFNVDMMKLHIRTLPKASGFSRVGYLGEDVPRFKAIILGKVHGSFRDISLTPDARFYLQKQRTF